MSSHDVPTYLQSTLNCAQQFRHGRGSAATSAIATLDRAADSNICSISENVFSGTGAVPILRRSHRIPLLTSGLIVVPRKG